MLAGLFLSVGLVLSAMLATTTWLKVKNSQFITVKGSVQKNVEADLAIWSGSFQVEADTLLDAQHGIQADRALVEKFLAGAGVTNFNFAPIVIEELKASKKSADGFVLQHTAGYRLSQSVSVESTDVDRLDKLDSTPLVEQGVIFTVAAPQFIYSKSPETKIEMLADATKDALRPRRADRRRRADVPSRGCKAPTRAFFRSRRCTASRRAGRARATPPRGGKPSPPSSRRRFC